jgi:hypothetical protein
MTGRNPCGQLKRGTLDKGSRPSQAMTYSPLSAKSRCVRVRAYERYQELAAPRTTRTHRVRRGSERGIDACCCRRSAFSLWLGTPLLFQGDVRKTLSAFPSHSSQRTQASNATELSPYGNQGRTACRIGDSADLFQVRVRAYDARHCSYTHPDSSGVTACERQTLSRKTRSALYVPSFGVILRENYTATRRGGDAQ